MKRFALYLLLIISVSTIAYCNKPSQTEKNSSPGIIKGTVYSPNGAYAIAAATIETEVNGEKKSVTTNKEGKFSLELPAGNYEVNLYTGAGNHFSRKLNISIEAGKTIEIPAPQSRLAFTGKIAYIKGTNDKIEILVEELGIPATELTIDEIWNYETLKQYDILLLNCGSGYIDFEENKILEKYLQDGHSIYASDFELKSLSKNDWGFIPKELISYELDGVEGATEGNVKWETFKTALGKDKVSIEFDAPMYVQIKQLISSDQRFKVLVDHPVKGPLALNIQWSESRISDHGKPYGGNVIYTTFHDARLSAEVKVLMQQMIWQL